MVKALIIGVGALLFLDGLIEVLNPDNNRKLISLGKGVIGAGLVVSNIRKL